MTREIRIELDPARMQALGITAVDVNDQLRNLNQDAAGGRAQLGGGEQSIRVLGGASTATTLGETQIMLPGGRFARLSDLAVVRDSVGQKMGLVAERWLMLIVYWLFAGLLLVVLDRWRRRGNAG